MSVSSDLFDVLVTGGGRHVKMKTWLMWMLSKCSFVQIIGCEFLVFYFFGFVSVMLLFFLVVNQILYV
jgi:hypothetical protein